MVRKLLRKLSGPVRSIRTYGTLILLSFLAGQAFSLLKKMFTGEFASLTEVIIIEVWLVMGTINLFPFSTSFLPLKDLLKIFKKAFVWPWHLYRDPMISIHDKTARIKFSLLIILGAALWFFIDSAPGFNQLSPDVKDFSMIVRYTSILLFFTWGVYSGIVAIVSGEFTGFITSALWKGTMLFAGMVCIAYCNDSIDSFLKSVRSDPASALIMTMAMLFVFLIFRFTPPYVSASKFHDAEYEHPGRWRNFSDHDKLIIATHEAGHALLFACTNPLPENIYVRIHQQNGFLGSVTVIPKSDYLNHLPLRSFTEWQMLLYLSGQVAERVLCGENTLGSNVDISKWQNTARQFLANGLGAFYFNPPENSLEVLHNHTVLQKLFNKQYSLLCKHLELNRSVLEDLATAILEKTELDKKALIPFLSRIQYEDDFPRDINYHA